jgi:hypothetical protein
MIEKKREFIHTEKKWTPRPPGTDGEWYDKGRDHPFFQYNVSIAELLGGAHSTEGCPTPEADRRREAARLRYYEKQMIRPEVVFDYKNRIILFEIP